MNIIKTNEDIEKLKEKYNNYRETYISNGYIEYYHIFNNSDSTTHSIILGLPIIILYMSIYFLITNTIPYFETKIFIITLVFLFLTTPIHEFLHGIGWCIHNKNNSNNIYLYIPLGFADAYCHCSSPLNFKSYIIGSLLPFIILSLTPFILSCAFSSSLFFYIALAESFGCGSDILNSLNACKHINEIILDYPTDCGFTSYKKNVS